MFRMIHLIFSGKPLWMRFIVSLIIILLKKVDFIIVFGFRIVFLNIKK
jgi:hypothetical protein